MLDFVVFDICFVSRFFVPDEIFLRFLTSANGVECSGVQSAVEWSAVEWSAVEYFYLFWSLLRTFGQFCQLLSTVAHF